MSNWGSKIAIVTGSWIGLAIGMFFLPMLFLPVIVFGWVMWGWASPVAIYTFIYDKQHMAIAGFAMLLFLILAEGFKATLDEAPALARIKAGSKRRGWLQRYYLHRNRELIEAYELVQRVDDSADALELYLMQSKPGLYRHHTEMLSFFPDWMLLQHVSGHHRAGHVRHTKNGPAHVRSHHVSGHSKIKRR